MPLLSAGLPNWPAPFIFEVRRTKADALLQLGSGAKNKQGRIASLFLPMTSYLQSLNCSSFPHIMARVQFLIRSSHRSLLQDGHCVSHSSFMHAVGYRNSVARCWSVKTLTSLEFKPLHLRLPRSS